MFLALIAVLLLALPARAEAPPIRMLHGLEVVRLDPHRLNVLRGSAADNAARATIQIPRTLTADIRVRGVLGRDDVATPADAARFATDMVPDRAMPNGYRTTYAEGHRHAGAPLRGWYYPVYLGREPDAAGRAGGSLMLTRQVSSMRADRPGDARAPSDFPLRRHAPIAFFYEPEEGFRPMTCQGWPQPYCIWTLGGTRDAYALLADGRSTQWSAVSAEDWVPDTGRLLRVQAVIRSTGGRGGAWIKPLPTFPGDLLLGWVNGPGEVSVTFADLATTSAEHFVYRVEGDVSLSLYAIGFSILQPF